MQSENLKPCPFCGHSAHIEQRGDPRMSTIYQCDNCGCRLETGEERDYGAEWNRRAEDALSKHAGPVKLASDRQIAHMRRFWEETPDKPALRELNAALLKRDFLSLIARLEAALSTDRGPVKTEPYGYAFQHEDTGLEQVVDVQQVEWGFEKNNPRWQKLGPVYLHRPPEVKTAPAVAVKERQMINNMLLSQVLQNAFFAGRGTSGIVSREDMAAWQDYDPYHLEAFKRIRSALSAQAQDVAVDGADIGRCIRSLSVEHPLKWADAENKPSLRGWFVGQVMKHFDGKPDEKRVRELIDIVFAMYPASKHGDAE